MSSDEKAFKYSPFVLRVLHHQLMCGLKIYVMEHEQAFLTCFGYKSHFQERTNQSKNEITLKSACWSYNIKQVKPIKQLDGNYMGKQYILYEQKFS